MINQNSSSEQTIKRLEQAEHLKILGKYQEALDILEKLLLEDPENVSALEEIADNELGLEHFNRAEAAAIQAIGLDRKSYTGHYILGFLNMRKEEWGKGIERFKTANKLKINNPEILRCLGWTLFNDGKKAQGIVTLERSLNLDNENLLTLCDLGVAYLQTGNMIKSKNLFQKALEIDPCNERVKHCVQAVERYERTVKKII
ncbi:MAG: hypothetical protein KAS32_20690 [Candidatus Peribacteraceae bacterium]|nr:hypothetical protein [Candidatus Peribacteraceae bacterium]